MIIMARILTPSDYGLIGMLAIFMAISQSLVDSGFSQALIRKQDRTDVDNSTVFYFNIVIGLCLYLVLYLSAPYIARFYNQPILVPLTRWISISIILNSLVVVQRATLTIKIDFKTQAKASFIAAIASGVIGITMASLGYGVWAIVCNQLSNLTINTFILWILSRWRPSLKYSWQSFKELFGFGSKIAVSGIIETIYRNIYLIVIGKLFNAQELGFYTRAQQFADFPSSNLTGIISRVTFPIMCTFQDDDNKLQDVYRRFLRLAAFIIFPLMIGVASLAFPLISTILGNKWAYSAQLLQILCLGMMLYPVHAININLLQVKGRSDLFLKLEICKKIIGIALLCATFPFGLIPMCWGIVLYSIISLFINTHYTGKLIHIGFFRQIKDLLPTLSYSISMGIIILIIISFFKSHYIQLAVGCVSGALYYLGITKITRSSDLKELLAFVKSK